jgi:hypothetical protein
MCSLPIVGHICKNRRKRPSDPPEVPENGLLLPHGPVLAAHDQRFLRKIDDRGLLSCKVLQKGGKTGRAILLIQLMLCRLKVAPPLQAQEIFGLDRRGPESIEVLLYV